MEYEELLKKYIGDIGKYQIWILFLTSTIGIGVCFSNVSIVFLAAVPEHHCLVPGLINTNLSHEVIVNISVPVDGSDYPNCENYARNYSLAQDEDVLNQWLVGNRSDLKRIPCDRYHYDTSQYKSSIVSQWNLVCDQKWMVAFIQSTYMAGILVGTVVSGQLSDRFGRRLTSAVCIVLTIVTSFVSAFAPNFAALSVLRFFLALFSMGAYTCYFVINMELVGPAWRNTAGFIMQHSWAMGYLVVAIVAYGIRDWFTLQLVLSALMVPYLLLIFLVPESPRWLYANNRNEQGDALIQKMAKWSKVEIPKSVTVDNIADSNETKTILDLLRTPVLRRRSIVMFYAWFVGSMVYYGLSLNSSGLGGDPYINFLISGAVEIPAYIFCQVTFSTLGRRYPLCFVFFIGGLDLLCILAVPVHMTTVLIVLSMAGKFFLSAAFAMVYNFAAEIFPTQVRNIGVGTSSMFARVGGVIAPYVGLLSTLNRYAPSIIFGCVALIGSGLVLLLPETKDRALPETIEDAEQFTKFATKRKNDTANAVTGETMIPLTKT